MFFLSYLCFALGNVCACTSRASGWCVCVAAYAEFVLCEPTAHIYPRIVIFAEYILRYHGRKGSGNRVAE